MIKQRKYILKDLILFFLIAVLLFFASKGVTKATEGAFNASKETINDAYGTKCEVKENWVIGEYEIKKKRCVGYAGPDFYKFDLIQKGKPIIGDITAQNSCTVEFEKESNQIN